MTEAPGRSCVLLGAGAQGRVVLETWRAQHPAAAFCFLDDDPALVGLQILGAPVRGSISLLQTLDAEVVVAVGHNGLRLQLAGRVQRPGVGFARPVHPSAVLMPSATVGPGTVVLAGAVINSGAIVGAHVIVNTGALVEHDAVIEDGVSLSPRVAMGGRVQVGRGAFVGTGATLAPRVRIGAGAIVGAGAVVLKDVPAGTLAHGVPARTIREVVDQDWNRVL